MYGNGAGIGMVTMLQVRLTRTVLRRALYASIVAAAGTPAPIFVARISATAARRCAASATWAFALCALCSNFI